MPQVYLGAPDHAPEGAQFAVRALASFNRVRLDARQSQTVTLHVPWRSLEYWSTASHRWMLAEGQCTIYAGASSRDLSLSEAVNVWHQNRRRPVGHFASFVSD